MKLKNIFFLMIINVCILMESCSTNNKFRTSDYFSVYVMGRRPNTKLDKFSQYIILNKVNYTYEWGKRLSNFVDYGKYKIIGDTILLSPYINIDCSNSHIECSKYNKSYGERTSTLVRTAPLKLLKKDGGKKLYDVTRYYSTNNLIMKSPDYDEVDSIAECNLHYINRNYILVE